MKTSKRNVHDDDKSINKSNNNEHTSSDALQSCSTISDSTIFKLDLVGSRIYQIIIPVTLCSIYTIILIKISEWNVYSSHGDFIERAWRKLGLNYHESAFEAKNLVNNLILVSTFILILIIVSLMMLFVLYIGWHAWLGYYFYIPSIIMMAILTPLCLREVLYSLNCFGLDFITLSILIWNFTFLGLISIFSMYTHSPLCLQQFYLIHNSTILAAVILTCLPSWTPWLLLGILVFWDLFAVLAPFGPLKLIINMAERAGVIEMPGLIYSTESKLYDKSESLRKGVREGYEEKAATKPTANSANQNSQTIDATDKAIKVDKGSDAEHIPQITTNESKTRGVVESATQGNILEGETNGEKQGGKVEVGSRERSESKDRKSIEEDGVNIGLGDFIFYSLLIGLTAKGRNLRDFYATIATFNAILVGLILTLFILTITRRPLPALPISVGLGICVAVLTIYYGPKFMNELSSQQIFI